MEELLRQILIALEHQTKLLERIAAEVEDGNRVTPNYQTGINGFHSFDWSAIGAEIEQIDEDGVAAVTWRNNIYLRRSGQNKFEPAIWFSRCIGRNAEGVNLYEKLITFKKMAEAEPLPRRVAEIAGVK